MRIQFLGGVRTVTGSMHRLEVNGSNVLLDCGLFQGRRAESYERNSHFSFDPASVDALVLSHAHIDHSGNIPTLAREGLNCAIYATAATRDLCAAMLRDSAYIQEQDAAFVNRKRARRGEAPIAPLYTVADAMAAVRCFTGLSYGRSFAPAAGVQATFLDAGHILGAALTILDLSEGKRRLRACYSGDLGRRGQPILRDPEIPRDVEVLIIESTYGNRVHEEPDEAAEKLRRVVNDTWRRGGKVIVPAFAVGRTQTLVYQLNQLIRQREIPGLPIYVDSPLAVNVTEVFRLHPECYDEETARFLADNGDPFGFSRLSYVRSVEESKALNFLREPAVIISASGMAEAGRILHHLRNNIPDPRNTVLLVGYQAEHTLGRRIQERRPEVPIFGELVPLRAQVEEISGFSAHADRNELLEWVSTMRGERLRRVLVVHGELEQSQALAEGLRKMGGLDVRVPQPGEVVEL
ncbi:MAG: MBL fold metallo-hydrolase RNA specificity domain-containing protein [Anaerolineae bacterium]